MQPSLWADISVIWLFVARYSPILAFLFLVRSAIARRTDNRLNRRIQKLDDEMDTIRSCRW